VGQKAEDYQATRLTRKPVQAMRELQLHLQDMLRADDGETFSTADELRALARDEPYLRRLKVRAHEYGDEESVAWVSRLLCRLISADSS
jgi:hypothetical protein